MKLNIKIIILIIVFTTSCIVLPRQTKAQVSNVSFQIFYDQLSPYGQWIDYRDYGYVWIPDSNSDADFAPYSNKGYWVFTEYGWTWASDYKWGWAAFHYGRWSFNNSFGWFWIPDNEWGPAWVNWREADGYYGWSPMEPGVSVYIGLQQTFDSRNNHWLFVEYRYFVQRDMNHYIVNRNDRELIGRNSRTITNTYIDDKRHITYAFGPLRNEVQVSSGRSVTQLRVKENNNPGQVISSEQLRIYRPQVGKNNREKFIPIRVTNVNNIRHLSGQKEPVQHKNEDTNNNADNQPNGNEVTRRNNSSEQPNRNIDPVEDKKAQTVKPTKSGRQKIATRQADKKSSKNQDNKKAESR